MGLFNRIFGKGDDITDSQVEKEIEQIKSGEINKVYPILKPGDWVGIQAGAIKQTIFGTQEDPVLVIAYGYDTPDNFVFLMPKDIDGKDPQLVLQEANENLENFEQKFDLKDDEHGKMLFASGGDFSSEKILCSSHMLEAHRLLEAEELLVSIPRRTCMYIMDRNAPKEQLNMFIKVHTHTWEDDSYGNAPILNALFVVKEGEIDGIIPLEK